MQYTNQNFWTETEAVEVVERWEKGESAGVIANAMNRTRNSVMGYLHRHGYQRNGDATRKAMLNPTHVRGRIMAKRKIPRVRSDGAFPAPPLPLEPPWKIATTAYGSASDLFDRPRQSCCWPINDGDPFLFCCAEVGEGERYCVNHFAIMYCKRKGPDDPALSLGRQQ